ncbi:MAG: hypothetical protein ABFS03_04745 [Chloroflexota bacterium]
MSNIQQVRTLTTNFSTYQGLKGVPLGLLLSIISLWASAQTGPAKSILFPLSCSLVFIYLYWVVHRFYMRIFGTVMLTRKQKMVEVLRGFVLGTAALAAFWIDVSLQPAFSMLGLVFAGSFLLEYLRIHQQSKERLLLFYPAAALFLILLSVLPIMGINWWNPLGIKALIIGICTVAGLLIAVLGVLVHISLENILQQPMELNHE